MTENLEEGDLVLCTVDRIVGTIVFVKIHHEGKELEGSITFSEIAPGRIRNIRDYVVPKKKIVCKVLRISGDRIDLTFRRVSQKEEKEIKEKEKLEKSYENILKGVLGEKGEEVLKKISEEETVYDFLESSKENPEKLEKLVGKQDLEKILEVINSQKKKNTIIKKEISLISTKKDGLESIKKLLGGIKDIEIRYISSGKYSLKKESEDPKKGDQEFKNTLLELEKSAKKDGIEFSVVKEKG
ncbi:MAG: hypothetical protein WDZ69_02970 [Candidatus Pacearchaeota archaeon]